MPSTPYPWTENWHHNLHLLTGFADAVSLLCDISAEDHKHMMARRALRIQAGALQDAIVEHGAVLGDLLDWVGAGIEVHNACSRVPESFTLKKADISPYRNAWTKHATESKQSLSELKGIINTLVDEILSKRKKFESEDTGGYSSYSDYSEDETDSDEGDEEDYDEEDEEDYHHPSHRHPRQPQDKDKDKDKDKDEERRRQHRRQ